MRKRSLLFSVAMIALLPGLAAAQEDGDVYNDPLVSSSGPFTDENGNQTAEIDTSNTRTQVIEGHSFAFNPQTGLYTQMPSDTLEDAGNDSFSSEPPTAQSQGNGTENDRRNTDKPLTVNNNSANTSGRVINFRDETDGRYRSRNAASDYEGSSNPNQEAYERMMGGKKTDNSGQQRRWYTDGSDYESGNSGVRTRYDSRRDDYRSSQESYYDNRSSRGYQRNSNGRDGYGRDTYGRGERASRINKDLNANKSAYDEMMSSISGANNNNN